MCVQYLHELCFSLQSVAMDQIKKLTEPGRQFAKDSIRLVKRCTKPDRKGNTRCIQRISNSKYSLTIYHNCLSFAMM